MKKNPINIVKSTVVPLNLENIDTDQIIPARFLKAVTREGFGKNLFCDWRYLQNGSVNSSFVLNDETYQGKILLTGKNFGCGSSREHAAWALYDYGFKAVVSSSFADIFKNNALNNNLLTISIPEIILQKLFATVRDNPQTFFEINLVKQTLSVDIIKLSHQFEIDPYKKICLMNGYDDIDYLLSQKKKIIAFERNRPHQY